MTADQLEIELNKNSGLKGIAKTSDMKTIIEQMQTHSTNSNPGDKSEGEQANLAKLAFDMFIQRLRASICAMRASLPKLDALVFTAGIGENSALVREKACAGLDFLGIELDERANKNISQNEKSNDFVPRKISPSDSQAAIFVIRAHEDWAIAQQCEKLTN